MPDTTGAASSGIFFMEYNLLLNTRPPATMFYWPANTSPTTGMQLPLPGAAFLHKHMLIARTTAPAYLFELATQIICQPAGNFTAELFIVCTKA
jgi:hypothetical protein